MHWETRNIHVTCFIAVFALLRWSATEPTVSMRSYIPYLVYLTLYLIYLTLSILIVPPRGRNYWGEILIIIRSHRKHCDKSLALKCFYFYFFWKCFERLNKVVHFGAQQSPRCIAGSWESVCSFYFVNEENVWVSQLLPHRTWRAWVGFNPTCTRLSQLHTHMAFSPHGGGGGGGSRLVHHTRGHRNLGRLVPGVRHQHVTLQSQVQSLFRPWWLSR